MVVYAKAACRLSFLACSFSVPLSAQQSAVAPMLDFFVGLRSATAFNFLGDMTGQAPSLGAIAGVQCSVGPLLAVRANCAFDDWGKHSLRGTANEKCEVRRLAGTIGLILPGGASDGEIYLGVECGVADWSIDSTYAPLSNWRFYKPAAAFVVGCGVNHFYFELSAELSFIGNDRKVYEVYDTIGQGSNFLTLSFGYKF
jgi:hypothetical protein